ncbi:MAG TPA: RagB/SusD family nutrient uptake outer membrane protein [Saprospiraceae bacterium]|nr:RagB/SusD family nutrient uptake outer membrane protein [Saprospiraceae bacterium]
MKRKLNIIFTLSLLALLSACSDKFLEDKPESALLPEEIIKSKADVQAALNGAYDALTNENVFGGQMALLSELMADGVDGARLGNNGDWQAHYSRTTDIFLGTTRTLFNESFKAVARANFVLKYMHLAPDINNEDKNRIEGECKFIRAIIHFEMTRFFGQPFGYNVENSQLGIAPRLSYGNEVVNRASVAENYNLVIKDLKEAVDQLPASNGVFANSWAAKAYLAKVYFQMNDFQNAYNYANDVIQNSGLSLDADFSLKYKAGNEASHEIIFGLVSTDYNKDNANTALQGYFKINISNNTVPIYASKTIFDEVSVVGDLRATSWFTSKDGVTKCTKFDVAHAYTNPLVHLTEMKLIRVEALAELNQNLSIAISDINEIKQRAGLAPLAQDSGPAQLISEARKERHIELYFENNRLHELKRQATRGNKTLLIRGAPWDCPGLVCQLPDSELKGNPAMESNPQGGCL